MNNKTGFNPLSRTSAHRRAMLRNMVTSLFRFERITTTSAKAKEVRRKAEKLITRGKVDSVANRRLVAKDVQDAKILNKLFTEIGPRMKDRNGGYTRILKMGFRQGDAADVVILELVDYKLPTEEDKSAKASKKSAKSDEKNDESKAEAKKAPAKKASTKKSADSSAEKKPAAKKAPAKKTASKAKSAENAAPASEEASK